MYKFYSDDSDDSDDVLTVWVGSGPRMPIWCFALFGGHSLSVTMALCLNFAWEYAGALEFHHQVADLKWFKSPCCKLEMYWKCVSSWCIYIYIYMYCVYIYTHDYIYIYMIIYTPTCWLCKHTTEKQPAPLGTCFICQVWVYESWWVLRCRRALWWRVGGGWKMLNIRTVFPWVMWSAVFWTAPTQLMYHGNMGHIACQPTWPCSWPWAWELVQRRPLSLVLFKL